MDHDKKLAFVLKMTKHGLDSVQHFDDGGTALSGPTTAGNQNAVNPASQGIAGAVGSVLGTNNNFQATGANVQAGTNQAQLNNAYSGVQGALGQTGALSNTLTPGVAQGANSQNTLTNELGAEASGQNSTAAQTVLNNNTGANIAQQAALMASQRGAGSNAGLLASQHAAQGAATQQTAVGQGAATAATNQLAAQGQLANLASTQVNQGTAATQLNDQSQQNEQNILQGANTAANNANVSSQSNINSTNAAVAAGNQNSNANLLSNVGNALGGISSGAAALFAKGGQVGNVSGEIPAHLHEMARIYHPHFASGGMAWENSVPVTSQITASGPVNLPQYTGAMINKSSFPSLGGGSTPAQTTMAPQDINASQMPTAANNFGTAGPFAADNASQMPSTGDLIASDAGAPGYTNGKYAKGGNVGSKMKKGGEVPGKPKVDRDAYKNDTVSAKLSPGEVVIDLNTLNDQGKLGQMARFVAQNIERKKAGRALK